LISPSARNHQLSQQRREHADAVSWGLQSCSICLEVNPPHLLLRTLQQVPHAKGRDGFSVSEPILQKRVQKFGSASSVVVKGVVARPKEKESEVSTSSPLRRASVVAVLLCVRSLPGCKPRLPRRYRSTRVGQPTYIATSQCLDTLRARKCQHSNLCVCVCVCVCVPLVLPAPP
jgi:hypothetical protein